MIALHIFKKQVDYDKRVDSNKREIEKRAKRQKELEELLGVLTAVFIQFKRVNERIIEARVISFEPSLDGLHRNTPTPRLIVIAIEANMNILSLKLHSESDRELLGKIIRTYEEHTHLNNRWNLLEYALKHNLPTHYQDEVNACNEVQSLTADTIKTIDEKINSLKKDIFELINFRKIIPIKKAQ